MWQALKGMALIDLGNTSAKMMCLDILDGFVPDKNAVGHVKIKSFIETYLKPFYFNRNALFDPVEWAQGNWLELKNQTFVTTTNASESLHALISRKLAKSNLSDFAGYVSDFADFPISPNIRFRGIRKGKIKVREIGYSAKSEFREIGQSAKSDIPVPVDRHRHNMLKMFSK